MAQLVYFKDGTVQVWYDEHVSGLGMPKAVATSVVEVHQLTFVDEYLPIDVLKRLYPCQQNNC